MEPRPLRVVHVIHGLVLGGLEQMMMQLAARGREQGVEPLIISFGEDGPVREVAAQRGLRLDWLRQMPGMALPTLRRMGQLFNEFEADLLHAHDLGPWLNAATARAFRPQAKVIATFHQLLEPRGLKRVVATAAAVSSKALVACGHEVRNELTGWVPRTARVVTIGNGIPIPPTLEPAGRARARERMGLPEGAVAFGYLGRMHEEKGPELVLEAFLAELGGRPEVFLVLIGGGPMLERLRERARGQANVTILGEVTQDASSLLQGLDIYVQGSRREGRSLALLEAMAAGLPTIAHDLPAIAEIHSPQTALLVPLGQRALLQQAMAKLAGDPRLRRRMGQQARQAVQSYSVDRMVEQYLALYRGEESRA